MIDVIFWWLYHSLTLRYIPFKIDPSTFMNAFDHAWLIAFIDTQLIEVSLGFLTIALLLRFQLLKLRPQWIKTCLILLAASTITHPPLWYLLPRLCRQMEIGYQGYLILGETLVVLIEGFWYALMFSFFRHQYVKAFFFSLLLNTTSALIGIYLL